MAKQKKRVFTVEWDQYRERYVARSDDEELLGVSTDINTAIGSAVREAGRASRLGCTVVVKAKPKGGKFSEQYVAHPPG